MTSRVGIAIMVALLTVNCSLVRTIFRVLRSWPRMLAKGFQLPPIIHLLQFKEGTPRPLANCIALCKIWSGQCDASVGPGIGGAVTEELEIILNKVRLSLSSYLKSHVLSAHPLTAK